jgi:cytochrome c553
MRCAGVLGVAAVLVCGCATETEAPYDPLDDYDELDATRVVEAPSPEPGQYSLFDRDLIDRGEYLVELLACGSCHTNGAFDGAPDMSRPLAGSDTGIGRWSDRQIANAIRAGAGRHTNRRIAAMPWQAYAKINDDDVDAIVAYLRSIKPIRHKVPEAVNVGEKAHKPFIYYGVYRRKN